MDIKELIGRIHSSFFVIFSGSVLAMYVLGLLFEDENTVPLHNITALLVMTVLASLAYFIFYSNKELSRRQMQLRHAIHMLTIMGIMLGAAFFMGWISWGEPLQTIAFVISVVAVYIMVVSVGEYQSKKLAGRLTEKLNERYRG